MLYYTTLQYIYCALRSSFLKEPPPPPESQTRACPDRANFFTNRLSHNAQNRSRRRGPLRGDQNRATIEKGVRIIKFLPPPSASPLPIEAVLSRHASLGPFFPKPFARPSYTGALFRSSIKEPHERT